MEQGHLWWRCRRCGIRTSIEPERHRCLTENVLRFREERLERRNAAREPLPPEVQELADYAKKSAMKRILVFIDNVLAMASGSDE
jgi:hypothetical protein